MKNKLKKALVADDNRIIRIVLCEFFEQLEVEVAEAKDGREALELILSFEPQLVVADMLMPHLTGFELADECRQMDPSQRPIVFLTTAVYKSRQTEHEALTTYEARAFFRKPIDLKELKSRISDCLEIE